jgi:chromosome segregation ATPase
MSTAGKVLIVLILLLMPAWIILVSGVARLNTEATRQIADLKAQIEKLEADVAKTESDIQGMKDRIGLEQRATAEDLEVIRARLAEVYRARTEVTEIQERVKLDMEMVEAEVKGAGTELEQRKVEQKAEEKALADTRAEVTKLQAETSDLMDELARLREEFKATVATNRKLVEQLLRANERRTARPASFAPGR